MHRISHPELLHMPLFPTGEWLNRVAQGGDGVCILGDAPNPSGHGPKEAAPADPALCGQVGQDLQAPANLSCSKILNCWNSSYSNCFPILLCNKIFPLTKNIAGHGEKTFLFP